MFSQKYGGMDMKKHFTIIATIVLISLAFNGCALQSKNTKQNDINVDVYTIPSPQSIFLDGQLAYEQQQTFVQDSTKGTIDTINVVDTQQIKKGQALFSYKNEQEIQQYDTLTQQLENLQYTYKQIQLQLNNLSQVQQQPQQVTSTAPSNSTSSSSTSDALATSSLNATPNVTSNTKDSLQSQLDQNNQQQKNIQKQLDNIKNSRYTTIVAPFDGVVSLSSNSDSATDKSILTLTNPKMQVVANVSEKDIFKLKIGQVVKLTIYGTTEQFNGTIRSIDTNPVQSAITSNTSSQGNSLQASANNVSYYPVDIDIDNQDGVYSGFHVQGTTTAENQLPKVPVSSVFNENGKSYLWLVNKGKLKKVQVDVEKFNDTSMQVKSGVDFGEKIVSKPSAGMKEGDAINASTIGN